MLPCIITWLCITVVIFLLYPLRLYNEPIISDVILSISTLIDGKNPDIIYILISVSICDLLVHFLVTLMGAAALLSYRLFTRAMRPDKTAAA